MKLNKKAMTWSEVAKWIIIAAVIIIVILAIITPSREYMFKQLTEFFDKIKFGT